MDAHAASYAGPDADPLHDPAAVDWERYYSMGTHFSLQAVWFLFPVVPALVMWLIKKNDSPFVDDHGKEAVNFQISLCLYSVVSYMLMVIGVGFVLLPAVWIFGIVGMILAMVAAGKGRYYRYPATLRLIK